MATDITVFSRIDFAKHNGVVYADTQQYPNDTNIHTLSEIFTSLPTEVDDGKNFTVTLVFGSDVYIGKKITTTDSNGNTVEKLVGRVFVPAKSPVIFTTQFVKSVFFADDYLAFQVASSTPSTVVSAYDIDIQITSPDPMV